MILSGKKIAENINKNIIIEPYNEDQLNPNSYNLRLHNELLVYDDSPLDMKFENKTSKLIIPETGIVLEPGKLYLGRTLEYTKTKKTARKSSLFVCCCFMIWTRTNSSVLLSSNFVFVYQLYQKSGLLSQHQYY